MKNLAAFREQCLERARTSPDPIEKLFYEGWAEIGPALSKWESASVERIPSVSEYLALMVRFAAAVAAQALAQACSDGEAQTSLIPTTVDYFASVLAENVEEGPILTDADLTARIN